MWAGARGCEGVQRGCKGGGCLLLCSVDLRHRPDVEPDVSGAEPVLHLCCRVTDVLTIDGLDRPEGGDVELARERALQQRLDPKSPPKIAKNTRKLKSDQTSPRGPRRAPAAWMGQGTSARCACSACPFVCTWARPHMARPRCDPGAATLRSSNLEPCSSSGYSLRSHV